MQLFNGMHAVGLSVNGAGTELPYAALWNGSKWSELELSAVPEAANAILEGVSCPSVESCMAVGFSENSARVKSALGESWNGGGQLVEHLSASASRSKERDAECCVLCGS